MRSKILLFLCAFIGSYCVKAQTYCTPAYTSGCSSFFDDINTVTLTGANSTSINQPNTGCSTGAYANYTSLTPVQMLLGTTYSGTMNSDYVSAEYVRIWIDFNDDGTLAATEEVGTVSNMGTTLVPYSIVIPLTATPGNHRMRMRCVFATTANTIDPCTSATYGETHDYTVTIVSPTPCSGAPTIGSATASPTNVCNGSTFTLSLSTFPLLSGLSYQWQSSPSNTGPWTNVGTANLGPSFSTTATSTLYYRCIASCGTFSTTSTAVQVTVPALFPAGTYTINSALPTGGINFHSVNDAVSAILCGISGPVIFNAVPGSGPYNEQVIIPAIANLSATNTVTFNGNYDTLRYNNTTGGNYAVLTLNDADYITFKKWVVVTGPTSTYGFGIQLTNKASHNVIDSNILRISQTSTSSFFAGIVLSGSVTSATSYGNSGDSNMISNNAIYGGYYSITCMGASTTSRATGNVISGNKIFDYYIYGIYIYYNNFLTIEKNDLSRPTRTDVYLYSFYGIYSNYGGDGLKISKNKIHNSNAVTPTYAYYYSYPLYLFYTNASASNPCEISNNAIYNIKAPYYLYGVYLYDYLQSTTNIYNNTFIYNDTSATGTGYTYGIYEYMYNGSKTNYKNNILYINRKTTGVQYGYYVSGQPLVTGNRNDYYVKSPLAATTNYIGYYNTAQATLAAWKTASGMDTNSMNLNPYFDVSFVDSLYPTNDTLDNMCLPIAGITTDILGKVRNPATPDVGAFEFSRKCDGPGYPGTVLVSDTGMCPGYIITLTDTTYQKEVSWLNRMWQQTSNNGSTWYNVANSANKDSLHLVFPTTSMKYRLRMICQITGDTTYSNTVSVTLKPPYKCYCYSMAVGGASDSSDIGAFSIGSFSTNVGGPHVLNPVAVRSRTDYTDYGPIILYKDSTYTVNVYHTMRSLNPNKALVTMFMDYNNNLQYDYNTNESVTLKTSNNSAYSWTAADPNQWYLINKVTIPHAVITNVPTGLRLVLNSNTDSLQSSNPQSYTGCGTYTSGETEDYVVIFKERFPAGINSIAGLDEFVVYPNPNNGLFSVSFKAQQQLSDVQLIVTDITGRVIQSVSYGDVNGSFLKSIDLGQQAKGIYLVELKADSQKIFEKVMVK